MNTGIAHIDLASYISLVNPPFELSKIEICLRRAFNSVKIEFIENMSLHGELLIKYNISVANPLHTTPINLGLVYSQPTSGVLFLSKANFYMSLTLGPDHVIGSMLIRHFKEQTGSYQNISPGRFQNTSSSSFISFEEDEFSQFYFVSTNNKRMLIDDTIFNLSRQRLTKPNSIISADFNTIQFMKSGIDMLNLGHIEKGLNIINESVSKFPNDPNLLITRAMVFVSLNKLTEAVRDYLRVIELDPNIYECHYNLGNIYYDTRQFDLAINHYSDALRLNQSDSEVYTNRGNCYLQVRNLNLATNDFKSALAINSEDRIASNALKMVQTILQRNI